MIVRFLTTGTWTCPQGVTSVLVECIGGGGAGGNATGNPACGSGGSGGCYARSTLAVTPGVTYTVTVGTGGAPGNNGGSSWFNTLTTVRASGGVVGEDALVNSTNGAARTVFATTNIGDVTRDGGFSSAGNFTSGVPGGAGGGGAGTTAAGGNASAGTGGTGGAPQGGNGANGVANSTVGANGSTFGGAGSGGKANNNTDRLGGSGANGIVIIHYNEGDFLQFLI